MKRNRESEIPGTRYGRWTVIGISGKRTSNGLIKLDCICDCGATGSIVKSDLVGGISASCGCYKRENTSRIFRKRGPLGAASHRHYSEYKGKAAKRNIYFDLSESVFGKIVIMDCWYCGTPPREYVALYFGSKIPTGYLYNGLDRVDNGVGYIESNVVACCPQCNRSKNKFTYESFVEMCHAVAQRHPKRAEEVGNG